MPKIIDEHTTYVQKIKYYTLDFNGCQIEVKKWWKDFEDYDEYENDYVILNDEEVREELSDEDYDEVLSFIITLV